MIYKMFSSIVPCYFLALFVQLANVKADCYLSLNKDFGQPSPVLLQDGRYLAPNSNGIVVLGRSDTIMVACPGNKGKILLNNVTTALSELEAHCIINETFRVDRWIGPFKSIKCSIQPWFTTEETSDTCYGGHKMYRVGYKVKNSFHALYEACFDKYLINTLYVVHELSPKSKIVQGGNRPQFLEGDLFGKTRIAALYKVKKQADRINSLLGYNSSDKYISNKQFLTRGHLAPRADFPLRAEQRASFHYVNTAPQWLKGNAGDWAALEEALRRRVVSLGRSLTVFTGTHGVMTLADGSGRMQEFYLGVDVNNNGIVPVPMYFYKVVYDAKTKKAAAFISINSSFYTDKMIRNLTFCEDICDGNSNFNWLRWRSNDGTFSFCCDYNDFMKTVKHLPRLDVAGLFY